MALVSHHPGHTPMPVGHHSRPLPPPGIVLLAAVPTIVPFLIILQPSNNDEEY